MRKNKSSEGAYQVRFLSIILSYLENLFGTCPTVFKCGCISTLFLELPANSRSPPSAAAFCCLLAGILDVEILIFEFRIVALVATTLCYHFC